MAAVPLPGDNPTASEPVACSLGRADLADQARRWTRLAARAMTGRQQTADGVRVGFRPGPGPGEELRPLVAGGTRWCPWAAWTGAGQRPGVWGGRARGNRRPRRAAPLVPRPAAAPAPRAGGPSP